MGIQQVGAGKGMALVSMLSTAATAATQVARMLKATEDTAGVVRRTGNRMMKDDRVVLGVILGALGLGFLLGFAIGRARKGARVDGSTPAASDLTAIAAVPVSGPVTEMPQTKSDGSAEATEGS